MSPKIRDKLIGSKKLAVHTPEDLGLIVRSYLEDDFPNPPADAIVGFYRKAGSLARQSALLDGAGRVCSFSLRNLTRSLRFALRLAKRPQHATPPIKALAQGLAVGFATTLDLSSSRVVEDHIQEAVGVSPSVQTAALKAGSSSSSASVQIDPDKGWINVEGYWIKAGPQKLEVEAAHRDFVITNSVRRNLHNIARMLSGGRFPILLEGPTSAGKTSLVKFLAHLTGHEFVRINNHEHTDLQEYIGQYVCDPETGQLVFQEGVLVRAARAGHWVVLDELNLAPSEVLEALNRLLDDNRELYIPDTGNTVKPHEEFMVFATQNPAGANYGGRKLLSRAFRNRFTEVFVSELPMEELAVVLHKRCQVPPSYVKVMLAVYQDLQSHRNQSAVFLGKQSFMTVRDLLRWSHRKPNSYLELATEGFTLLAERLRKEDEREVVRKSLVKHCTGVKDLQLDYSQDEVVCAARERVAQKLKAGCQAPGGVGQVVWTPAFCRMVALIGRCIRSGEPALLVGETGGGKTMACQLLSWALVEEDLQERQLRTLNCHQQTETSDFIGSLRPVRGRDTTFKSICTAAAKLQELLQELAKAQPDTESPAFTKLLSEAQLAATGKGNPKNLGQALRAAIASNVLGAGDQAEAKRRRLDARIAKGNEVPLLSLALHLVSLCGDYDRIFEWADGALVEAMRSGGAFLVDEISLAEDSVLERLNSVLEPEHSLLLAEKPLTGADLEVVQALPTFRLFATMNPGGDFGKRELSPALRNRFTEIWVEPIDFSTKEAEDLVATQLSWPRLARPMLDCVSWFNQRVLHPLSIREVLAWATFVRSTAPEKAEKSLQASVERAVEMYLHGGCMTLVDSLGLGNQLVDTECIALYQKQTKDSQDENCGGLSVAQRAILWNLLCQLDRPEFFQDLTSQGREKVQAVFSQGGFAWVRNRNSPPKGHVLNFGGFDISASCKQPEKLGQKNRRSLGLGGLSRRRYSCPRCKQGSIEVGCGAEGSAYRQDAGFIENVPPLPPSLQPRKHDGS
ncbi:mdn1 [Symbiodinium necroappetens]|uniref:Midasin n=1 Tax=Symbiodinium necroappetens TaxID=1628268 RepID=A0A812YII8_9DINO|nr:mdn1 [Symbiodinium necroappetens]